MSFDSAVNRQQVRTDRTRRFALYGDWRSVGGLGVNGSLSTTGVSDDGDTSEGRDTELSLQASWQFGLARGTRTTPSSARLFIRYAHFFSRFEDRLFDFVSDRENWTINVGLTVSLF